MKVIANRSALSSALALAAKAAPAGGARLILTNVLLVADAAGSAEFEPTLSVYATNLTVAVRHTLRGVEVKAGGTTLVPAGKFRDIVKESDDDTLSLEVEGDQVVIQGHDSRFKLNTTGVEDFPPEPEVGKGGSIQVPFAEALAVINKTRFAAGLIDKATATEGVLFNVEKDKLQLVATDGRRMAISWMPATSKKKADFVVPRLSLALVASMPIPAPAPAEEGKEAEPALLTITWSDNRVVFEGGDTRISSVLVEGTFPPYEAVVPTEHRVKATLDRASFQQSLKRAALFVSEASTAVKFEWTKAGVRMESVDPAEGEAGVSLACPVAGGDLTIGFQPSMIREGLEHAGADEVSLEMTDPNRPGLLRGTDFLYVAMPMGLK